MSTKSMPTGRAIPGAALRAGERHLEEGLQVLREQIQEMWGSRLFSLVAVGSIGRAHSEQLGTGQLLPEDFDLIAVTDATTIAGRALRRGRTTRWAKRVSRELGASVSLGVLRGVDLPHLPFTLFNYEMRHGSRILCGGDPSQHMPAYDATRMPKIEAVRLLLNRGVPLWGDTLRVQCSELSLDERVSIAARNRKAMMGIGDALLIGGGCFHWSYRGRIERAQGCTLFGDVDYPALRQRYIDAICARLRGELPSVQPDDVRSETLSIFGLHEQVFRLVEGLRLEHPMDEWTRYAASDIRYPRYLYGSRPKRIVQALLTFGPPRGNGFYRRQRERPVEEILLRAFPRLAYGQASVSQSRELLNWPGGTSQNPSALWRHFCRLWAGGR